MLPLCCQPFSLHPNLAPQHVLYVIVLPSPACPMNGNMRVTFWTKQDALHFIHVGHVSELDPFLLPSGVHCMEEPQLG